MSLRPGQSVGVVAVAPALHWYRVVISNDVIGPDFRAKVQAKSPDAALRDVMRTNRIPFARVVFIYRLFSHAQPSRRYDVRCRLSR